MRPLDWLHRRSLPVDRPAGPPNPFEACLLAACVVQGAAAITGYAQPTSFVGVLPRWGRLMWGALMFLGGAAAVTGLYWPGDPVDGVIVKRAGLITLIPLTLAYGLAGMLTDPAGRFVTVTFSLGFAGACAIRVRQVTIAINGLHGQLRGLREEWENGADP